LAGSDPRPSPALHVSVRLSGLATLLFLFIFRTLGLYERPQYGHFIDRIPRLVRACGLGILLATALAFVIQTDPPFSRLATGLALITVSFFVILERNILFQLERHWAKHQATKRNVILLGTGATAVQLETALHGEPRRRARISAFVRLPGETPDPALPADRGGGCPGRVARPAGPARRGCRGADPGLRPDPRPGGGHHPALRTPTWRIFSWSPICTAC
jgi:hypothetical protein